jgi:hypothetical protein
MILIVMAKNRFPNQIKFILNVVIVVSASSESQKKLKLT